MSGRKVEELREKIALLASLLAEVAALDDGDEPFAWKHEDLFSRIRAELPTEDA